MDDVSDPKRTNVNAVPDAEDAEQGLLGVAAGGNLVRVPNAGPEAIAIATSARRSAGMIPLDFGAVGDGDAVDSAAVRQWAQATPDPYGYKMVQAISGVSPSAHLDFRGATLTKDIIASLNLVNGASMSGATFENGVIDMNRRNLGNVTGHGMSLSGHDITIRNMEFRDFGSDGVGGGAGINVSAPAGDTHSRRIRLMDSNFYGDISAPLSFGYVLSNVECSSVSNIYVHGVLGGNAYAHELKNDARYNVLSRLIGDNCGVVLAYGQQTEGIDGADYNVATDIVGRKSRQLVLIGEGFGNVTVGGVLDATDAPGDGAKRGVTLTGDAAKNVKGFLSFHGDLSRVVDITGNLNYNSVADYTTASQVVRYALGSWGNVTDILHTGDRTSIIPLISDASGNGLRGSGANVVTSQSTGERIGTRSGYFLDAVALPGASFTNSHPFRKLADTVGVEAIGTTGAAGNIIGMSHAVPGDGNRGAFWHALGAAPENDRFIFRGFGQGEVLNLNVNALYPSNDLTHANAKDLGRANTRFKDAFIGTLRPGSGGVRWTSGVGSPEGVISAPVGSFYTREDARPGAVLWVKESGSGSTGWAPATGITPMTFGAIGDGIADDTAAIIAALTSGKPVNWGNGTYRHTGIDVIVSKIDWRADGATLVYDGPYVRNGFRVAIESGEVLIQGRLTFDAAQKCNTAFRIDSTSAVGSPLADQPVLKADGLSARGALRVGTSIAGGDGIYVVGGWQLVRLTNSRVRDCFMAVGAGVFGSQGIFGITVSNGTSGYAKRVEILSPHVENIWSLDPSYKSDQDGVRIFQSVSDPAATSIVRDYTCINVSGRAIKWHSSANPILDGLHRILDASVVPQQGLYSVPDIDSQQGPSTVSNVRFVYNGSWHGEVVRAYTDGGAYRYAGAVVNGIAGQVLNAAGAGITVVGLNSSADGTTTYPDSPYRLSVTGIAIEGNVSRYIGATVRGSGRNVVQLNNAAAIVTEVAVIVAGSGTAQIDVQIANAINLGDPVPVMATTANRRLQAANIYGFT